MIQWVYEAAIRSKVAAEVVIATPDDDIVQAARRFGAPAMLTSLDHPSGTDRIAEVARSIHADVYINVQGDEPLIPEATIRACSQAFDHEPPVQMSSVYAACLADEIDNPAVVKVVTDLADYALYFSRYAIPYPRNERRGEVKKHIGIYGYRREVVQAFADWPQSPLERAESLEQLRFLENGIRIKMMQGQGSALAVDTPEQAQEVRRILESRG